MRARRIEAARALAVLGSAVGVEVRPEPLTGGDVATVDATIATLPGGTDLGPVAETLASTSGPLVDVVYGTWPTPLAQAWTRSAVTDPDVRSPDHHDDSSVRQTSPASVTITTA